MTEKHAPIALAVINLKARRSAWRFRRRCCSGRTRWLS